jgi:hypothetical protein
MWRRTLGLIVICTVSLLMAQLTAVAHNVSRIVRSFLSCDPALLSLGLSAQPGVYFLLQDSREDAVDDQRPFPVRE